MGILDRIAPNSNFVAARPEILRYFDGEMSAHPKVEVLVQGTVVLGEVVAAAEVPATAY